MRQICDEAPGRCDGYNPTRFRQMVDSCNGDFLPIAKRMLCSGEIQAGLMRLAKHDALDISMEAVVQQDPWCSDFSKSELDAATWRMSEAKRRVAAGEPADSAEW